MKTASRIALAAVLAMLLLLPLAALATGKPPVPSPHASAQANATSTATASQAMTGTFGGGGDAWAVGLPGHGSPSYAGQFSICVKGRGVLWNAFWTWDPDPECVRLIAEVTRLAAIPVPVPARYPMAEPQRPTHAMQAEAVCPVPAKAKSVQAARAAGACR